MDKNSYLKAGFPIGWDFEGWEEILKMILDEIKKMIGMKF